MRNVESFICYAIFSMWRFNALLVALFMASVIFSDYATTGYDLLVALVIASAASVFLTALFALFLLSEMLSRTGTSPGEFLRMTGTQARKLRERD